MASSLFSSQERAQRGAAVVPGACAPANGGYCGMALCLQAALAACEQDLDYSWLMGMTGAAFCIPCHEGFDTAPAALEAARFVVPALTDLGRSPILLSEADSGAAEGITREIHDHRPCLALGWGPHPREWALVVGVENRTLLGYSPGADITCRRAPVAFHRLLLLGECRAGSAGNDRQAMNRALHRALQAGTDSLERVQMWAELLQREQPYGDELTCTEQIMREQWVIQYTADALQAQADFLCDAAALYPEETADDLHCAACHAEKAVEIVEAMLLSPDITTSPRLSAEMLWLADNTECLQELADELVMIMQGLRRVLVEEGVAISLTNCGG